MNQKKYDSMPDKPLCLIIGPIGEEKSEIRRQSDMALQYIIRPALEDRYFVKRADEDSRPGLITHQLFIDIRDSKLIVADLSKKNPNVFYELGVAHALEKKVIHIFDVTEGDFPFDVKDYRAVIYDPWDPASHKAGASSLRRQAETIENEDTPLNPVSAALGRVKAIDIAKAGDKAFDKLFEDVDKLKKQVFPSGRGHRDDEDYSSIQSAVNKLHSQFSHDDQFRSLSIGKDGAKMVIRMLVGPGFDFETVPPSIEGFKIVVEPEVT